VAVIEHALPPTNSAEIKPAPLPMTGAEIKPARGDRRE